MCDKIGVDVRRNESDKYLNFPLPICTLRVEYPAEIIWICTLNGVNVSRLLRNRVWTCSDDI